MRTGRVKGPDKNRQEQTGTGRNRQEQAGTGRNRQEQAGEQARTGRHR